MKNLFQTTLLEPSKKGNGIVWFFDHLTTVDGLTFSLLATSFLLK